MQRRDFVKSVLALAVVPLGQCAAEPAVKPVTIAPEALQKLKEWRLKPDHEWKITINRPLIEEMQFMYPAMPPAQTLSPPGVTELKKYVLRCPFSSVVATREMLLSDPVFKVVYWWEENSTVSRKLRFEATCPLTGWRGVWNGVDLSHEEAKQVEAAWANDRRATGLLQLSKPLDQK